MSDIPKSIRKRVFDRERALCLFCSSGRASEIHHRMRRREAGHTMSTCILLCSTDHRRAHAEPEWARKMGLIVPTFADTLVVPVKGWRGWMFLDNDGGLEFADGDIRHALDVMQP